MANAEHLAQLRGGGVDAWNHWREEHLDLTPDLSEAHLRDANLEKADLRMAPTRGNAPGEAPSRNRQP